jgi:hypothetical protein
MTDEQVEAEARRRCLARGADPDAEMVYALPLWKWEVHTARKEMAHVEVPEGMAAPELYEGK